MSKENIEIANKIIWGRNEGKNKSVVELVAEALDAAEERGDKRGYE